MNNILLKARAKINVGLDIADKRADGYHELRTVMQTVGLHDTVFIKKIDRKAIKLVTNLRWLPTDERNIVYRAVDFLIEKYNIDGGVFIEITKNIPVAAGLGGGSSNCAAALVGMRNLFGLPVTNAELMTLGRQFGADVPYCLMRGTALAEGIGERLKRLSPHPDAYVLLAKPPVSISTPELFGRFELTPETFHPDIDTVIQGIRDRSLTAIADALGNTLEDVTASICPAVPKLKRIMLENSALAAQMSGTGPTVFGYFHSRAGMRAAENAIARQMPEVKDVFLTYIYNPL
ncbi:MAG: 4-(cytidine 5'-diphospho)-2-C-methyl-D-erythritol kinase [Defluviitaleaceae bacterium]|nr:4-(cytidine 5'-diphospho)-2-C-methyl-D-erythritol kinase [Defluviitaleaceae bacterium]